MAMRNSCTWHRSGETVVVSQFTSKENIRSPEELHYTLGKTIGSGTYAKVKAAWCPYERKMVSPTYSTTTLVLTVHVCISVHGKYLQTILFSLVFVILFIYLDCYQDHGKAWSH